MTFVFLSIAPYAWAERTESSTPADIPESRLFYVCADTDLKDVVEALSKTGQWKVHIDESRSLARRISSGLDCDYFFAADRTSLAFVRQMGGLTIDRSKPLLEKGAGEAKKTYILVQFGLPSEEKDVVWKSLTGPEAKKMYQGAQFQWIADTPKGSNDG